MKANPKVYLSCPMSGRSQSEIREAFANCRASAMRRLRAMGVDTGAVEVIDPSAFQGKRDWYGWMMYDLRQLRNCDIIVMGLGWSRSRGCRVEKEMAEAAGLTLFFE